MQFPAVATEKGRFRVVRHRRLVVHHLPGIPLVDIEPIPRAVRVDAQWPELVCDGAVAPPCKDAACVRAKRDDVAELLEFREGFVDGDAVSLSVTFYGGGKTTEALEDKAGEMSGLHRIMYEYHNNLDLFSFGVRVCVCGERGMAAHRLLRQ